MNRKDFIKKCGMACLSFSSISLLLDSCSTTKFVTGIIENDYLKIAKKEFEEIGKNNETKYKKHVIIHHDKLKYPICLFRLKEEDYSAVWMQCSHQGAELQTFGDKLLCPAHGSEFDNKGTVMSAPADKNLRTFPLKIQDNEILISLK